MFKTDSYAAFGELVWHVTDRLKRQSRTALHTMKIKHGTFNSQVSGGLEPRQIPR